MIQINIKTTTFRKNKNAEVSATPKEIFNELEISTNGIMISLNGAILSNTDLQTSFINLGINDGDSCYLSAIVKADGAM